MTSFRNTASVAARSAEHYERAIGAGLMQVSIRDRKGKQVTLPDGRKAVEFVNCSYLALDTHPDVIAAAKEVVEEWGSHFCCARSRFSIEPLRILEDELSAHFRGRAVTFPSVTSAHMSALPLVASGVLLRGPVRGRVRLIFDRFAHASMQYLRPLLAVEAGVVTIGHNDLDELVAQVRDAHASHETPVYVADGVYSMGGHLPVREVLALSRQHDFHMYVDDAHGTSIFGERGEGYVLSQLDGEMPEKLMVNFSLAKGFGCNGGGIIVPTTEQERLIRSYGQTYAFSGPLDFAIVGAARAALRLHHDGTVAKLQQTLWRNVAHWTGGALDAVPSPIRMVMVGEENAAIDLGKALVDRGLFVSTAFFPVVPRAQAQLRVCLTVGHSFDQIDALKAALGELHKP